jgi:glycosyltransferase involved in cell wall biosynthesis
MKVTEKNKKNNPLTIGFISVNNYMDFPIGGGLYFLRSILKYWDTAKDKVLLFGCGPKSMKKGWHTTKINDRDYPFFKVYTNEKKSLIPGRLKAFIGFLLNRNVIHCSGIDILYVHEPGLVLTLKKNRRVIVQQMLGRTNPLMYSRFSLFRRRFFVHLYDTLIHKRSLKRSTSVIALTEECNQFYKEATRKRAHEIIPTCADTDRFTKKKYAANNSDEIVILYCGRLNKVKGLDLLLRGFFEFLKTYKDSKLIIVGEGQEKYNLHSLSQELQIDSKVEFLGFVDYDRLPEIHQMADIFVMTSFREGLSVSMLEAMASGLAIVSTDNVGAKEVIVDGYNGILLKNSNRNPIILSKLLEKAFVNRKLLGARARKAIEEKYSAKIVAGLVQHRLHTIYETKINL